MGEPSFALAVIGYLVVAVLLEQYDNRTGGNTFWIYTAIIWLAYATAHREELRTGLTALVAAAASATASPAK